MTNKQIASVLFEVADVLEIKDPDDRFRFNAFRTAGQKISALGDNIVDVYNAGGIEALRKIPTIGQTIADAIAELITTGRYKDLEALRKQIPLPQLEFSKIPSVGPKNAAKLYELTGAKTIEALARKIKKRKTLGPFKEKTLQNVLRGIELLRRSKGRILLGEALPVAQKIVAQLEGSGTVEKINVVGSLRRCTETVGDIDIVAASSNPREAISQFTKIVKGKIIAQGDTKCTIVNEDGVQVDLEILPKDKYGSLLQHFTGSKEHNIAFRSYLQLQNLSFSEHGIKKLKAGRWPLRAKNISFLKKKALDRAPADTVLKCATEQEVYNYCGMDWIAPELRENRGEVTQAIKGELPRLVEEKNIKGDLQMHTIASDGEATLAQMAGEGQRLGYSYIAITDHSPGLAIAGGQSSTQLQKQIREIDAWNKKSKNIKIIKSIELNINADGSLDMDEAILRQLDFITASVHSSFRQSREKMNARLERAISSGLIDNIGHPTGRLIGRREGIEADWDKIYKLCADYHVALEINANPHRLDLSDKMIIEAKQFGVKFTISTDAHSVEGLSNMIFGLKMARRGWLEAEDILNTRSLSTLMEWVRR